MGSVVDLFKWLLEKDIPAKHAVSALCGLAGGVAVFALARNATWFQGTDRYLALSVAFIACFLATSLIWHYASLRTKRRLDEKNRLLKEQSRIEHIRETLFSLTDWQRRFLLRFITEGTRQIPEFQVGQFRAVWDFEMAVLVTKGVVIQHQRAGVYEIDPEYHDYLVEHWDQEAETLN